MSMHDSALMNTDELLDSYDNDGYVYCIMTGLNIRSYTVLELNFVPLVKIGKIGMKKNETEQQVLDKLIRRYNTYYPDFEVIMFMRTGNCHKAELSIFETLKHLHYRREIYTYKFDDIHSAFEKAAREYPNIQEQLEKADISVVSELNKKLRARDL
jgi:hypothetical protein